MWSALSLSSLCSRRRVSSSKRVVRRCLVAAVAAGTAFAAVAALGIASAPAVAAAVTTAPSITQCDPPDFPITAGFQVTCTVTVVNNTSSTGCDQFDRDHECVLRGRRSRIPLLPA